MSDNKAALNAFREEVSAWMSENVPADPGFLLPLTFLEVGTEQQLNATQAYIRLCYESIEAGTPHPGDIALLKVQASEVMEFCAREAMQILGGLGYMRGNRVERIYREVRVNAIGGGSEEIMRDLATRQYGL